MKRLTDAHPREPGRRTYLDGVRAAAPIGVAAVAFGVSFGVLARSADMGRVAPIVMSVTTFAGSAQFAAVSILGAGGGLVTAIVAAVLLNLRYGPIGLSAATTFEGPWWWRALTAQLIVDESWAISQRDDGRLDRHLLVGALSAGERYDEWRRVVDGVERIRVADDALDPEAQPLDGGASARNITSRYDGTALIAAAHLGHDEVVRQLIAAGAPLDHVNNLHWTAAIEAVVLGDGGLRHQRTLSALIEAGKVRPRVDRRYRFAEIPGAIAYLEQGRARAKVVVEIA